MNPLLFLRNKFGNPTISTVIDLYRNHEHSPFKQLRPETQKSYEQGLKRLERDARNVQLRSIDGSTLAEWHQKWSKNGRHNPLAHSNRKILLQAISFGTAMRIKHCKDAEDIIRSVRRRFARAPHRTVVFTAENVIALRNAAHLNGAPHRALAYSLCFEITLRLTDVIGQWNGDTWQGLVWDCIDDDEILKYTPSKTLHSTGARIAFPLSLALMVQEEMARIPVEKRVGALIKDERRDRPYAGSDFNQGYRADRKLAGLPDHYWARDLRASGITEGRASGASIEDGAKVAGHTRTKTTSEIYDRANLEAATRFATARIEARVHRRTD